MVAEAKFVKELSKTDVTHRLSFPLENLGILPPVAHEHEPVEFPVSCRDRVYTFRCVKRSKGRYLKPVIEKGWSAVVDDYDIQPGDFLEFYYVEASGYKPAHYWIEVFRWEYYSDEVGTSRIRHRIV